MDKKELMENLGKVSAGDRNQDPAIKATENNTEKRKNDASDEHEPGILEKLGNEKQKKRRNKFHSPSKPMIVKIDLIYQNDKKRRSLFRQIFAFWHF